MEANNAQFFEERRKLIYATAKRRDDLAVISLFRNISSEEEYAFCLASLSKMRPLSGVFTSEGWNLLHYAACDAERGRLSWQLPLLLKAGLDINEPTFRHQGNGGCTVLHFLSIQGAHADIELLLKHGANVDATDALDRNALTYAIPQTVHALIAGGIDVEHQDQAQLTALLALGLAPTRRPVPTLLSVMNTLIDYGASLPPTEGIKLIPEAHELIRVARHARALKATAPALGGKARL